MARDKAGSRSKRQTITIRENAKGAFDVVVKCFGHERVGARDSIPAALRAATATWQALFEEVTEGT